MKFPTPVARFSTLDLFGVLMPGFFMTGTVIFAFLDVLKGRDGTSVFQALLYLEGWITHWSVAPSILFLSYLIGSIPRAFIVGPTDDLCSKIRRQFRAILGRRADDIQNEWRRALLTAGFFPYPSAMQCTLNELVRHEEVRNDVVHFLPEEKPGIMAVFDYWKLVICNREPRAFAYIQSLEARVRFFVGMFWAGVLGAGSALVSVIAGSKSADWVVASICLLTLSGLVTVVFGMRLRFVRGEEACQVFSAHAEYKTNGTNGGSQPRESDAGNR